MAVTTRQEFVLRTLDAAFKAANRAKLDPTWTLNHDELLLICPQCRIDGIQQRARIERAYTGGLQAHCNGCDDAITPGIIALLENIGRPPGNVVAINPELNGHAELPTRTLGAQTWRAFEQTAGEDVNCIIKGLWPEAALGFIGAAPKAGKTWLGLDIAVSVATGTPVFGSFPVPVALPVLYVALEGHKAAIRTRIGCIARGHGVHPEDDGLYNLHLAYKPKGINLASPDWAAALCDEALELGARFVIIDVLRRAAQIKENDASSFMELVDLLNPLSEAGIALGMLHHFNKVNEQTSQRTPAERMAGSGAMFGAFDVGLFITKSENGARKLTIHTDVRDLAAPPRFLISLQGIGTAAHGGFAYRDNLRLTMEDAPTERNVKAPARDIRDWIINHNGGAASPVEIRVQFDISEGLLRDRRDELALLGIRYTGTGKSTKYESTPQTPQYPATRQNAGSPEHPALDPYYVEGIAVRGKDAPSRQTVLDDECGVNLTDEDDTGYWAMLNAITEPEAREHDD